MEHGQPGSEATEGGAICAFGPCTCTVKEGDEYCAPTCRFGLGARNEPCKCGHAECSATAGEG